MRRYFSDTEKGAVLFQRHRYADQYLAVDTHNTEGEMHGVTIEIFPVYCHIVPGLYHLTIYFKSRLPIDVPDPVPIR